MNVLLPTVPWRGGIIGWTSQSSPPPPLLPSPEIYPSDCVISRELSRTAENMGLSNVGVGGQIAEIFDLLLSVQSDCEYGVDERILYNHIFRGGRSKLVAFDDQSDRE
jgi:hypothetical protein